MSFDKLHQVMSYNIFRVIELCFEQGVTTTWRDIYLFLKVPEKVWATETDIDEKIVISSKEELEMIRELLISKFTTMH